MTNSSTQPELSIVMPVYNEEGSIVKVVENWSNELKKLKIRYLICVYNDGSRDKTKELLKENFSGRKDIKIINKQNSGHGATILKGYIENADSEWIFQIDSDDEISCEYFKTLWEMRKNFDFLIGERYDRKQPISRKIVTIMSGLTVNLFYGRGVKDVNSPYRLMRTSVLKSYFLKIPHDTFAPNVIISGIVNRKRLRFYAHQVKFSFRQTGEVSIKKWKLLKASLKSFLQTVSFALKKENFM